MQKQFKLSFEADIFTYMYIAPRINVLSEEN